MKKVYKIFQFVNKQICIPSDDYYAKYPEWSQDDILILEPVRYNLKSYELINVFNTEEEAIEELNNLAKSEYIILPIYITSF